MSEVVLSPPNPHPSETALRQTCPKGECEDRRDFQALIAEYEEDVLPLANLNDEHHKTPREQREKRKTLNVEWNTSPRIMWGKVQQRLYPRAQVTHSAPPFNNRSMQNIRPTKKLSRFSLTNRYVTNALN